jgi:hypothetical protein
MFALLASYLAASSTSKSGYGLIIPAIAGLAIFVASYGFEATLCAIERLRPGVGDERLFGRSKAAAAHRPWCVIMVRLHADKVDSFLA